MRRRPLRRAFLGRAAGRADINLVFGAVALAGGVTFQGDHETLRHVGRDFHHRFAGEDADGTDIGLGDTTTPA
jgi:hypothetical protein